MRLPDNPIQLMTWIDPLVGTETLVRTRQFHLLRSCLRTESFFVVEFQRNGDSRCDNE